jgi:superfamily II DNA/RNA helicase
MKDFSELALPIELVGALAKQQITEPTPIQAMAIPVLLDGKDAYLNAETGTGKTLAYLLPLFSRLDAQQPGPQLVIVAPTHELAIQIQRQCSDLAQNAGWPIRSVLLIGGTAMERQIEKLKKKPQIVIGSPGRILELIEKGKLKTKGIRSVVIDEADRLLLDESLPLIRGIIDETPPTRQLVFASATEQPESAEAIAMVAPKLIRLRAGAGKVNENIEHLYLVCEERDKPELLRKLLHALAPERALVFVRRNEMVRNLAAKLAHHHLAVAELHATGDKRDRKHAMDAFRTAQVRVLIASDVAGRGLDITGITHIFNFDAPTQSQAYLHRVGRTARAGAKGQAITLMTADEVRLGRRFEKELGIVLYPVRLRDGRVVAADELEPSARADQPLRSATKRR